MKYLLFVIVLVIAVLGYSIHTTNNESSTASQEAEQVFAEIRIELSTQGRQLQFVLFAQATGEADCRTRTERVWHKVFSSCPECRITTISCVTQISPRYETLWRDEPTYIKYLRFTRGSSGERNGRMITWGVSLEESAELCKLLIPKFKKTYEGKIDCL